MSKQEIPYPNIRELREDAGLSQADIANVLNCSQVAYSYYEIGRRDIPTEVLIKLAKYYNCSVDYLLGLTRRKKPYQEKY
ncbi:helix-turn-helix transcriptional regulator [Roseburia hominis]|uniref:helix-turn-helix domain-containing protein n=1 Tax=Roseburia hominis TaxID=301301 RepID=UPI001F2233CB|nr:helix-turn-helix transcriptional regulator [Roseburia hominis]